MFSKEVGEFLREGSGLQEQLCIELEGPDENEECEGGERKDESEGDDDGV